MNYRTNFAAAAIATMIATGSAAAQTPALVTLKAQVDSVTKQQPFSYAAYQAVSEKARARVAQLIQADSLQTAQDFLLASQLAGDPTGFYESRRVEHELALTALVLGHPDALKRVAMSWDALNWSIGRGQRIGSFKRDGVAANMDPMPSPAAVASVFNDLAAARTRALAANDNEELQRLRDADQADRTDPITPEKQQAMAKNDPARRARVLEMIEAGVPKTGRDFHNAALVLQHGGSFDSYRLAHELAIAAVALGDTTAVWLISRTYDRMLLNLGHRQRLNTQFGGANATLLPVDSTAVSARIRRTLGSK